jgi:transcriptional regulator GlxA family with amidase domain
MPVSCFALRYYKPCHLGKAARLSACVLLRTTEMNVTGIWDITGFSTPAYFRKAFRNNYGVTPLYEWQVEMPRTRP